MISNILDTSHSGLWTLTLFFLKELTATKAMVTKAKDTVATFMTKLDQKCCDEWSPDEKLLRNRMSLLTKATIKLLVLIFRTRSLCDVGESNASQLHTESLRSFTFSNY